MNPINSTVWIFILIAVFIISCSAVEETSNEEQKEDEIYIFDEIPDENSFEFEKPENSEKTFFVIQIGAFSSLERADVFAKNSESKLSRKVKVNLNEEMNLYVVQLAELFTNKADAERVRANLWQMDDYNDAWIILVRNKKTIR